MNESLLEYANQVCGKAGVCCVYYEMDCSESEYNSDLKILHLGLEGEDYKCDAVVYHEAEHILQDKRGYLCLRLCQWGIFAEFFRYFTERDATSRAVKKMKDHQIYTSLAENYLRQRLLLYRKKIFAF